MTLEASNSIFELAGVIEYFSAAAAGEEDEAGAASLVTAFGLSVAGFAQEQTSKRPQRIVRIKLERTLHISLSDYRLYC